jgi:UDP-2,4-diacetamido-2,4,6-trideoxy-beta-L-altropyranose hydrolase
MAKIYFRADGNTKIGLGHITRSLALACMLKDKFECVFLIQNPIETIQKQLQQEHFDFIALPETENYLHEATFVATTYLKPKDIIVIDNYNFKTEYQEIIKSSGSKLVCIDDLHAWHHVADVIINHAGGISKESYNAEPSTHFCLGSEYALLRPAFLQVANQPKEISKLEKVFICFGGADTQNLSLKTAQICLANPSFTEIHLVVGSSFPHLETLKNISNSRFHLYQNLDAQGMCDLMQTCDLAIAQASSIAYEICSVGIYFLCGYYVDNQQGIYEFLMSNKLANGLSMFEDIENAIQELVETKPSHPQNQKLYFDGKSKKRLTSVFQSLLLTFRKASIDDIHTYFEWTNDPEVRANSLNAEPINWEEHSAWFQRRLNDSSTLFYLFEYEGKPMGQLRIEIRQEIALINYSIAKEFRGNGFGRIMFQKILPLIQKEQQVTKFEAIVKKQNIASSNIFQQLDFELTEGKDGLLKFILS